MIYFLQVLWIIFVHILTIQILFVVTNSTTLELVAAGLKHFSTFGLDKWVTLATLIAVGIRWIGIVTQDKKLFLNWNCHREDVAVTTNTIQMPDRIKAKSTLKASHSFEANALKKFKRSVLMPAPKNLNETFSGSFQRPCKFTI